MTKVKSRTQKAALNTTVAAISEVVQLICGLILPRLIIASYGSAYNGITSSVLQFLNVVSILTVGVAGATRVALYRSLADNDIEQTSKIIKATELYMRKVGYVLLGLVIVLTIVYPLVVDTGYSWIEVAPLIIAAGISASGRYFFGTPYNALLSADQSLYISKAFLIVTNIINVVASVLLVTIGCNIQVVKLVSALVLILNPALRSIYVRKKYKLIRKCEPDNSALSMRKDVMAHSIANIVHDNTDIIVLTVFCNVSIVSVYTVYNLVMNALKMTQSVFTGGTEAVFGNMWAKGEFDKIEKNLGYYEHIISMFVSIVFSTAAVMLLPFIALYTHGVTDVQYILPTYALVITAAQMFFSFRAPYLTLVQGVGHYKQTRNGAIAEAIINIVISVILVQFIGIVGVAVGTLIANIFRTVQYAFYIDNHLVKRGKSVFIKRIIWAIVNILIVYGVSSFWAKNLAYKGWLEWVLTAIIIVIISTSITLVSSLIFYKKDLKAVIDIAKRSIIKKNKRKTS